MLNYGERSIIKVLMSSRIKKSGLVLAALFAALFLAEGVLRLATPPTFLQSRQGSTVWQWIVKDPVLGWANAAGYESDGFRVNSYGFRGEEFSTEKPPGVTRIVCVGDSGTFGIWFGERAKRHWDSYPEYLRGILRDEGEDNVEVINAGVVGYNSSHSLRQFMTRVLALEPDILIVRIGFNDHAELGNKFFRNYYVKEPPGFLVRGLIYRYLESRLVRIASWLDTKLAVLTLPENKKVVSHGEFRENVRRFIETARERDIRILFIDYPLRDPETGLNKQEKYLIKYYGSETLEEFNAEHRGYQDILLDAARDEGVTVVDTAAAMSESPERVFSQYDFVHPNSAGAPIIAEEVYAALVELGWIRNNH